MADSENDAKLTIGFVGLGAMGYYLASHLRSHNLFVWNRTSTVSEKHSNEFQSDISPTLDSICSRSDIHSLFLCLPTSQVVESICESLEKLPPGTVVVDCTSGEPEISKRIAARLAGKSIGYCDCPVSGGPRGAKSGTVTSMIGGAKEHVDKIEFLVKLFSKKVVRTGPVGSGHAIKAINNTLNMTHLLVASEGLIALKNMGVDPEVALSCINGSSGRSLQTEIRIPEEVVSGKFDYGFKLGLMRKDVRIGTGILEAGFPKASILRAASEIVEEATKECGENSDYTTAVKYLEKLADTNLQSK